MVGIVRLAAECNIYLNLSDYGSYMLQVARRRTVTVMGNGCLHEELVLFDQEQHTMYVPANGDPSFTNI